MTGESDELIPWNDALSLHISSMDDTHREFIGLINQCAACSDKHEFIALYDQLIEHTRDHFANEEEKMRQSAFPAIDEHQSDHYRVLNEMQGFKRSLARGRHQLVKSYINERLPEWFALHLKTMDAALAAHLLSNKIQSG